MKFYLTKLKKIAQKCLNKGFSKANEYKTIDKNLEGLKTANTDNFCNLSISLQKTKFCINCETLFKYGNVCPSCGEQENWIWLSKWLKSLYDGEL